MPMKTNELQEQKILLQITNAIIAHRTREGLFKEIVNVLHPIFSFDRISILLNQPGEENWDFFSPPIGVEVLGFQQEVVPIKAVIIPLQAMQEKRTVIAELARQSDDPQIRPFLEAGLQWVICAPLMMRDSVIGTVQVCYKQRPNFMLDNIAFFEKVARQLSLVIDNMLAYEKLQSVKDVLAEERQYLKRELDLFGESREIVYDSPIMSSLMNTVMDAARTDTTILLTGETGTGKDLIARTIHKASGRSRNTFFKLNCAALVPTLIESELFGHEKGSFTGATAKKIGRFELADNSTLFLDEISELPLNTQAKLLQVLQDGKFERVGGAETIKTDVRIIAATNKDLARLVQEYKFREDLYYRLNIFPVAVPPLRERKEDIPLLGKHFMDKFCSKLNRIRPHFLQGALDLLVRYPWPGNVRELENFMERIIILKSNKLVTEDDLRPILNVDKERDMQMASLEEKEKSPPANGLSRDKDQVVQIASLSAMEKQHISNVLKRTKGVIAGPNGAARLLHMKRSTLLYRMKKLGINPGEYK
jgi:formate hydrogenlyase transcriptional activator